MSTKPNKWQLPMLMCGIFLALEQLAAQPDPNSDTSTASLKVVAVNGVQLHYQETGTGPPVVLIHGALDDYREWSPQIRPFSEHYRVVAYSRRYNYPNDNPETADHSAIVEARDLASLLDALKLERPVVIGHSLGGMIAAEMACVAPAALHKLVLINPFGVWLDERCGFANAFWGKWGQSLQSTQDRKLKTKTAPSLLDFPAMPGLPRHTQSLEASPP